MNIKKIRIYCGVYEQGVDISTYIRNIIKIESTIEIVYAYGNIDKYPETSLVSKIKKLKNFDALISIINGSEEYPLIMIEYSTAFPTDDHILQRFDFIYWSSLYKIVSIKISPTIFNGKNNGGGTKITPSDEMTVAKDLGSIYYHIEWPLFKSTNYVDVNNDRMSCPKYNSTIEIVLKKIFTEFMKTTSYNKYYENLFNKYSQEVSKTTSIKNKFNNSTRYLFSDNKKYLKLKFNRFGHGLDPEKGMLVFWSGVMKGNIDIEFVVQRGDIIGRESYSALFDGIPKEGVLMHDVKENYLNNKNIVSTNKAKDIFFKGLGFEYLLTDSKLNDNELIINDNILKKYLDFGSTTNIILLSFAKKILLTNSVRKVILQIKWNNSLTKDVLKPVDVDCSKKETLRIKEISSPIKIEDWITFASQYLLRKCNFKIITTSYPGSQSDRCILSGNGRQIKRDYIDIIAVQNKPELTKILLQENKSFIKESKTDLDKLKAFIKNVEKINNLNGLLFVNDIVSAKKVEKYIGVGGQPNKEKNLIDPDYIMNFTISNSKIKYSVALVNLNLVGLFKGIANTDNKLLGEFTLKDKIYAVV